MKLAGTNLLRSYSASANAQQQTDVKCWTAEVAAAQWRCSADVQAHFPSATATGDIWNFPLVPSGVVIVARLLFRNDQAIVRSIT